MPVHLLKMLNCNWSHFNMAYLGKNVLSRRASSQSESVWQQMIFHAKINYRKKKISVHFWTSLISRHVSGADELQRHEEHKECWWNVEPKAFRDKTLYRLSDGWKAQTQTWKGTKRRISRKSQSKRTVGTRTRPESCKSLHCEVILKTLKDGRAIKR